MKDLPKISVIVPIYNIGKYLAKCLDSIINQTYTNLEIICVNDGSSDNCFEILTEYASKEQRIVIINQENAGLSAARNAALAIAKGDYIGFVDSDDWLEPTFFEFLSNNALNYNADISICGYFEDNEKKGTSKPAGDISVFEVLDKRAAMEELILGDTYKSFVWNKLYKRDIFGEVIFPVGKTYEDIATTWQLFDRANVVVYQNMPLYHYLHRENSISFKPNFHNRINLITNTTERYQRLLSKYPDFKDVLDRNFFNFGLKNFLRGLNSVTVVECLEYYEEFDKEVAPFLQDHFEEFQKLWKDTIFQDIQFLALCKGLLEYKELFGNEADRKYCSLEPIKSLIKEKYNKFESLKEDEKKQSLAENVKVSIIVPVYNAMLNLKLCLISALEQSLHDIEVICVDCGSTDGSLQFLNEWQKKDYRIVILVQNIQDVTSARNSALKHARGEFVVFLDSDAYYPSTSVLERLYTTAKSNSAKVVGGSILLDCTDTSGVFSLSYNIEENFTEEGFISADEYQCDFFLQRFMYNNAFLKANNIYFPEYPIGQDTVYFVKVLAAAERIYRITDFVYSYREYNRITLELSPIDIKDGFSALIETLATAEKFNLIHLYTIVSEKIIGYADKEIQFQRDSGTLECINDVLNNINSNYIDNQTVLNKIAIIKSALKFLTKISSSHEERIVETLGDRVENPLVSVIIPVYNVEKWLRECLDSVCNQTLKNIEIICVNDGSYDNSLSILNEYLAKDSRILICNQSNAGLSEARNTGIKYAKGKYICFLDSDDYIEIDALEKQYVYANRNLLDIVYSDVESFLDNDCQNQDIFNRLIKYYSRNHKYTSIYEGIVLMRHMINSSSWVVSVPAAFFKREFINNNGLAFEKGIIHEDNLWSFKCAVLAQRVSYLPKKFYKRRVRNNSIMTKSASFANVYGRFQCYLEMLEFMKNLRIDQYFSSALLELLDRNLRNARNIYLMLSQEEQGVADYLPFYEKALFEQLIKNYSGTLANGKKKENMVELDDKVKSLIAKLIFCREAIENKNRNNEKLRKRIEQTNIQMKEKQEIIAVLRDRLAKKAQEADNIKSRLISIKESHGELLDKLESLNGQLMKKSEFTNVIDKSNDFVGGKMDKAFDKNNSENISRILAENSELQKSIVSRDDVIQKTLEKYAELQSKFIEQLQETKKTQTCLNEKANEYRSLQKSSSAIKQNLEKKIAELESVVAQKNAEIEKLHEDVTKKATERNNLRERLSAYKEGYEQRVNDINKLKGKIAEKTARTEEMGKNISDMRVEYDNLISKFDESQKHMQALEQKIEQIKNSSSYKIGRCITYLPRKLLK